MTPMPHYADIHGTRLVVEIANPFKDPGGRKGGYPLGSI